MNKIHKIPSKRTETPPPNLSTFHRNESFEADSSSSIEEYNEKIRFTRKEQFTVLGTYDINKNAQGR